MEISNNSLSDWNMEEAIRQDEEKEAEEERRMLMEKAEEEEILREIEQKEKNKEFPTQSYSPNIIRNSVSQGRRALEVLNAQKRSNRGRSSMQYYSKNVWRVKIKRLTWRNNKKAPRGVSELSNQNCISKQFQSLLNLEKYIDITDPIYERIAILLFAGLVEFAATQQYRTKFAGKEIELRGVGNDASKTFCTFRMDQQNNLIWHINGIRRNGSWPEMIQSAFNLDWYDALATLADMVNMDFSNLVNQTSQQYCNERSRMRSSRPFIPNSIYLSFLPTGSNIITLEDTTPIIDRQDQVISFFAEYKWLEKHIYLSTVASTYELAIGKQRPAAYFLNQRLLDKFRNTTVIFFQDASVALKLNKILGESRNVPPKFIISSHLGYDLSLLFWNYLYGHDVIFVPKPDAMSLAMVKCYSRYCTDHRIGSFKVGNNFFAHGDSSNIIDEGFNDFTTAEQWIFEHCEWLSEINYPESTFNKLIKEAMPFDEFEKLWMTLGVFKNPKQLTQKTGLRSLPSIPKEMTPSRAIKIDDVNLFHILRAGTPVMLVGVKNGAKHKQAIYLLGVFWENPTYLIHSIEIPSLKNVVTSALLTQKLHMTKFWKIYLNMSLSLN